VGTRLGEFQMERVLGVGGFGIVYLALDHSLMRHVAIKEYVPSTLVARGDGQMLTLRSEADAETFAAGLRSFMNEARLLASFDHPSLVKVHRFWEENGTAYMAMPYYDGCTLKDVRRGMDRAPDEAWLQGFIQPLLGALDVLHGHQVYHRDISPDNIMLLPDGRPVLLDFGSARRVVGGVAQALTAILKPNYAPVEQYADMASVPQGPWTDLYAVGAVVYFMLRGEPPMPAAVRAMQDELPLLSTPNAAAPDDVSSAFLAAIDWALAVNPQDRPHSVMALRNALNGKLAPPAASRSRGSGASLPAAASAEGFRPLTALAISLPSSPTSATRQIVAASSRSQHATHLRKGAAYRPTVAIATLVLCSAAFGTWTLSEPDAAATALRSAVSAFEPISPSPSATAIRVRETAASSAVAAVPVPPLAAAPQTARPPSPPVAKRTPQSKGPPVTVARPGSTSPAVEASPLDNCADKNFLMKAVCIRRACELPQLRLHAQCYQLRAEDEARLQVQLNR
jgi:serine/threonine protein kinase